MRSRFFVLNILIVLMLVACKEDEPIVKLPAAAAFETGKDTFDEGEPIEFINKSEHAISYLWRFGSNETSTEEHPVYTPHIPSQFQGMRFKVKLMAMGADGMMDSTEAYVQVSKRIFRGITIMEMSDSIKKKIPFEDGKSTELYLLTGFQAEPFEWINEYQTYPSKTIERDYTLPFEYDHSTT